MSKIGTQVLEDMEHYNVETMLELEEAKAAERDWELSKFTTEELQAELANRGYVNGVLVHPELDEKSV